MPISSYVDFTIPAAVLAALGIGCLFPIYLFLATRLGGLAEARAWQFLAAAAIMCGIWVSTLFWMDDAVRNSDLWLGAMILCGWLLFYLEVWALLSRGYTLGMVLTLYSARRPLAREELAARYRGGDGLSWILKHRVGGLVAAGLLVGREGRFKLTAFPGVPVAAAYRVAVWTLGLAKSG